MVRVRVHKSNVENTPRRNKRKVEVDVIIGYFRWLSKAQWMRHHMSAGEYMLLWHEKTNTDGRMLLSFEKDACDRCFQLLAHLEPLRMNLLVRRDLCFCLFLTFPSQGYLIVRSRAR